MIPHTGAADIGVVVEDLHRMESFYVELLGLERIADRTTAWGPMSELRFGASVLRLVQARDAPAQGIFGLDASTGIRYLTFDIDNFDETVAACRDAGVEFWLEVEQIRDLFIAMVKDPEGNVVEFIGHGEPR